MDIYIWGTGRLLGKVLESWVKIDNICGFIDNSGSKTEYMGKPVLRPEELYSKGYDAILVANSYAEEIRRQCVELGIELKKVIFLYNNCTLTDMNEDYGFIDNIVGKEYSEIIKNRYHVIRGMDNAPCFFENKSGYYETDYVRIKTLELVINEMKIYGGVEGETAEVGVFQGEFAQYINAAFPDKKCYLFDTFEGFNVDEALEEKRKENCTEAFIQAYKNTNLDMVLRRMSNLDNIIIKQGFFPESIAGLEENFAFVSIDVDFEESIYQALQYFYPRLNPGGYIFVHDYTSSLKGVKKAVIKYEKDFKVRLCKVPLCDANGTLIITKG